MTLPRDDRDELKPEGRRDAILGVVRRYKAETARLQALADGDDRLFREFSAVLSECNARLDAILGAQREGRP